MVRRKNKIVLKRRFYDSGSIKEALKDFKEICSGKLSNKKNTIEIQLKAKNKEFKNNLDSEFCNYVLGLMKNKSLV